MYIKNLVTGVIQECHNADVIAMCEKNVKEYKVSEKPITDADSVPDAEEAKAAEDAAKAAEAQKAADQAAKAEEDKKAEEAKAAEDAAKANAEDSNEENKEDGYESMKVEELRKVAKEKGVQGYANMNKETLIGVIRAHE